MKTYRFIPLLLILFLTQACSVNPPSSTATTSPATSATAVPTGVFAARYYPPLILNYDPAVWKDASNYGDTSQMVNYLQAIKLPTCTIGPEGPNGNAPTPQKTVTLGKLQYEFSSSAISEQGGGVVGLYLLKSDLPGYRTETGAPKFDVVADNPDWNQCQALAEKVLATLHSAQ